MLWMIPNRQPLERQTALPNCDTASYIEGRPRRNVRLPARLQEYVLKEFYDEKEEHNDSFRYFVLFSFLFSYAKIVRGGRHRVFLACLPFF
jgi:hypothetical protein